MSEIDRSNRSVAWRKSVCTTGYEVELRSERGIEFILNTDEPGPILKLYNLAVRLYLNGETVPRQRIWGEGILRSEIEIADDAAKGVRL